MRPATAAAQGNKQSTPFAKATPVKNVATAGFEPFGLGEIAGEFLGEAQRTAGVEEDRRTQSLDHLDRARADAGTPTITPGEIQNLFGQSITAAGRNAQDQTRALGAGSASESTFGGGALSAGEGIIESRRLDSLAQQQSSIASLVAQDRGAARVRQLQVDNVIAAVLGKDPAMQVADALGQLFQGQAGLTAAQMQINAAKQAAKDAEPEWWETVLGAVPGVGALAGLF